MQICEVCHTPFAWKQVSKSVALAYKPITCRTCKKRYHIRFSSRILASFLVVEPIGIFTFFSPSISMQLLLFIAFLVLLINLMALPYLIRYRTA